MLLSLKWLREFVPFEGSAEELGDRLTMLGLELEEICHPYAAIEKIVVGHVLSCERHPEADKLSMCTVDVGGAMGETEPLPIVCGAPNVAAGQKVPVALIGTTMPDGMVIKKAKLRGQPSHGMICSERELGLSDGHSGILVLPEDLQAGMPLVEALNLDTEVLDISVTPNRPDCLSVLGLAREVAMSYGLPLHLPEADIVEQGEDISHSITLEISDPNLCWLYQGRILEGAVDGPSPAHIRYRLNAIGLRPISALVDITNYILMELGQPLHAFDCELLHGARIIVSPARKGEKIVTLDDQTRILEEGDILIRDAQRPVALAGVMGGAETRINAQTHRVFLECAIFRPESIRRTSRRLGLSSDSSYRFERGVDQLNAQFAMNRACALMAKYTGGHILKGVCKLEPKPFVPASIRFRPQRAHSVLGLDVGTDFCARTLTSLGCQMRCTAKEWSITQPSWRPDLTREADLIEEVARVYGMDAIEPTLPTVQRPLALAGAAESEFTFWARLRRWAAGLGLNEALNYSFVGHEDLNLLQLSPHGRISIMNPLSSEQNALRTALAPGLLQNIRTNIAQGAAGIRLFELAHIFHQDSASDTHVKESGRIGFVLYGNRFDTAWPQVNSDFEYHDLKGLVENLCHTLHLPLPEYVLEENTSTDMPFFTPCVRISVNTHGIGFMGRVRPELADHFHARKDIWLAELDLDMLAKLHHKAKIHFTPLPVYPPVRRDITVIAPASLHVGLIHEHINSLKLPLLEDVSLIDVFEPQDSIERNLTFRLIFRHAQRTLKDTEVDKIRESIAQSLVATLGVRI